MAIQDEHLKNKDEYLGKMSYDLRLTAQTRNLFTALVKEQPMLYNDVDRSQEAKDERDRIWNSIGQRIGIPGKCGFFALIIECISIFFCISSMFR